MKDRPIQRDVESGKKNLAPVNPYGQRVKTLSANEVLTNDSEFYQYLATGGADRTVTLPIAPDDGKQFTITNTTQFDIPEYLLIEVNSTQIDSISPGGVRIYEYNGQFWKNVTEGGGLASAEKKNISIGTDCTIYDESIGVGHDQDMQGSIGIGNNITLQGESSAIAHNSDGNSFDYVTLFTKGARAERYGERLFTSDITRQETLYPFHAVFIDTDQDTPKTMYCDIGASQSLNILNNSAYTFKCTLLALEGTLSANKRWDIDGTIYRRGGTTTLTAAITPVVVVQTGAYATGDTNAWTLTVTANNTNDTLDFTVTGAPNTDIRWHGVLYVNEIRYDTA
jgi:hypothetical protein